VASNLQRLFLIGYRGCGKTTVGRLLAERLGFDFVDADEFLEERYGTTIKAIFATEGEPAFRDKESDILAELARLPRLVASTGGGVILRDANRRTLRESGFVVWLTAEPEVLWERISTDPTTGHRRPDLAMGGLEEVRTILAAREPLYSETAHLVVPAGKSSPELIVSSILAIWEPSAKSSG
jgi:shikimate kinase